MCGFYFFIHSAILCLLSWAFHSFTFKVIIDMYVPVVTLLIEIVYSFFFFLPCDLITIFGVIFGFLSLLCVYLL